jgi:propanol-preferring alcohol dehydrogenase
MRAVRFVGVGHPAQITDVAKPSPAPGQVLIKIGGAGVCHSDLHVMEEDLGFSGTFTLGHENAGWVAQLGEGVTGFKEGDTVAIYGPWGCGHCHACQLSMENYCENWEAIGALGGGLGFDGGMADYMLVPTALGPLSAWAGAITTSTTAARLTAQ